MDFINYELPLLEGNSTREISPSILKTRRLELGLTQQQVANGAHLKLKQYQRLEVGERTIEGASLLVALPICAVLKLDPFIFIPQSEEMNAYSDTVVRENQNTMKEESILDLLSQACELFNSKVGTNYSTDNVKLAFCTLDTVRKIYADFALTYGFIYENDPSKNYTSMIAESFVGQTNCDDPAHVDGILIRTDVPSELDNPTHYLRILIHELSAIFCCTNEIETARFAGQRFYDLYCSGSPLSKTERIADGTMNSGYYIWSNTIAGVFADVINPQPYRHIKGSRKLLLSFTKNMKAGNLAAKNSLVQYLTTITNSREGSEAKTWVDLEKVLISLDLPFLDIVHLVFNNLHNGKFYKITPEFISDLGSAYIYAAVQNTSPVELMRFANNFNYRFTSDDEVVESDEDITE